MRKLLTIILACLAFGAHAQTGAYPDFWRTPKQNTFTIVDGQFKAWYLNIPHYSLTVNRRHGQDSIGTFLLNTDDHRVWLKNVVGSTYVPLALFSDIPFLTFTNDFKRTVNLIGFADTLHRTTLPYTISNTSTSNPSLVVNSNTTGNIQTWNFSGTAKAAVAADGGFRSPYIADAINSSRSTVFLSDFGTIVTRNINDANPVFRIVQSNNSNTGQIVSNIAAGRVVYSLGNRGGVLSKGTISSVGGTGTGLFVNDALIPTANGDLLIGSDFKTIFGTSTISSIDVSTFTGGSGYAVSDGVYNVPLTGGTGSYASASITIASGVVTAVSLVGGGVNYTNGDSLGIMLTDASGAPVGSGFVTTVTGVSSYTGTIPVSARFENAPIQLSTISTPASFLNGMMWYDGTHLYGYIGGATRQLDQQVGVTSVFGRNGNVVAQSGDYNSGQVTESGNLYFTQPRVLATTLTGYSAGAGTITSSDNIITAIGKLQGNITASVTGVSSFNSRGGAVVPVAGDYASLTETLTNKNLTSGTNTFPTFNQNTTGSAATLTTSRTINGVGFNGSANITITANTPGTHTNGYGLTGSPFSGANQTWAVDTSRGKLVTTYGLLDTISAHGASAGYAINSTLFGTGTVAVDSTQVGSKAWSQAAFYTKAQSTTNFASLASANSFTALNTFKISSLGTGFGDAVYLNNPTLTTGGSTLQNSPNLDFGGGQWNSTVDNRANIRLYLQPTTTATLFNFRIDESANGGGFANILNLNSFGSLSTSNYTAISSNAGGATSTLGVGLTNTTNSTSGVPIQNSTVLLFHGSNFNTGTTAANYFDWKIGARGTGGATPVTSLIIGASQGTSSTTPTYTDVVSIDQSGNVGTKSVRGTAVTFANLPATPVEGMMVPVTDSSVNTWGTTITGGGANHVLAYYNGVAWTVAAK